MKIDKIWNGWQKHRWKYDVMEKYMEKVLSPSS